MIKLSERKLLIISVIIAFLALIAMIYIFIFNQKNMGKSLEVVILSENNLIDYDLKNVNKNLSIKFNEKEIPNISIINLQFINSGGQPILPQDYIEPIKISLSNPQEIISAKLSSSEPKNININFVIDSSSVTLLPTLLNSGDVIVIQITTIPNSISAVTKVKDVFSRIKGIKKIDLSYSSSKEIESVGFIIIISIFSIAINIFLILSGLKTVKISNETISNLTKISEVIDKIKR